MDVTYHATMTQIKGSISRHELELEPKRKQILDQVRREAAERPQAQIKLELVVEAEPDD